VKGGQRMDERWESSGNPHPMPMQWVGSVVKGWTKGGNRQAIPTLHPSYAGEGGAKSSQTAVKKTIYLMR